MPFKHKLIKELKKCVATHVQKISDENKNAMMNDTQSKQKEKTKYHKIISPKNKNIYQLFYKNITNPTQHVANFYNILGINEEAIRTEGFEQSYCRTVFYLKNVKKIDIKSNCVVLHLVSSSLMEFPSIQYTIDRYKSFGDVKFYHLANLMEEVGVRLKQLEKHQVKSIKEQNSDFFDTYLQSLGNRMFVTKTSSKMALSKSFLQTLEHCPEDYAIQTIKFRSSLHQGCSSQRYYEVMIKTLQNLKNLIDLLFDRISLETFLDNSLMRFRDILYTKNNKKVIAKVKVGMPNPLVTLFQVQQVLSISDQINIQSYFRASKKQEFSRIRQEFRQNDVKTLRNIICLPIGYLPENKQKMAGYREINQNSLPMFEPKQ